MAQGHRQNHDAGGWIRSVQSHHGPLKNFVLMKAKVVLHDKTDISRIFCFFYMDNATEVVMGHIIFSELLNIYSR